MITPEIDGIISAFPKIRKKTHQNGWVYYNQNPIRIHDLGVALFLETPIWASTYNWLLVRPWLIKLSQGTSKIRRFAQWLFESGSIFEYGNGSLDCLFGLSNSKVDKKKKHIFLKRKWQLLLHVCLKIKNIQVGCQQSLLVFNVRTTPPPGNMALSRDTKHHHPLRFPWYVVSFCMTKRRFQALNTQPIQSDPEEVVLTHSQESWCFCVDCFLLFVVLFVCFLLFVYIHCLVVWLFVCLFVCFVFGLLFLLGACLFVFLVVFLVFFCCCCCCCFPFFCIFLFSMQLLEDLKCFVCFLNNPWSCYCWIGNSDLNRILEDVNKLNSGQWRKVWMIPLATILPPRRKILLMTKLKRDLWTLQWSREQPR